MFKNLSISVVLDKYKPELGEGVITSSNSDRCWVKFEAGHMVYSSDQLSSRLIVIKRRKGTLALLMDKLSRLKCWNQ